MIGTQDLIIAAVILIVLFGARRLPELGKGLGQSIKGFKKAMNEPDEIDVTPKKDSAVKEEIRKEKGD